ncbi:MAG: hypothetical protein NT173_01905 [Opitutales bacterium]|nr:hypothetical protein [Opitutales bacterium]
MKKLRSIAAAIAALVLGSTAFAGFGTGWPGITHFSGNDGCLVTVVDSHWDSGNGTGNVYFTYAEAEGGYYTGGDQYYYHTYSSEGTWAADAETPSAIENTCIYTGIFYTLNYPIFWSIW